MTVICVHSYKGGTGKTTLSIHLAYTYLSKFSEVYLLETDFFMPTFHSLFPKSSKQVKVFSNMLYSDINVNFEEIFYPCQDHKNLFLAFANPEFDPADPIFGNDQTFFTKSLRRLVYQVMEFKDEHPNAILIIDTPPGYHFVMINNLLLSDIAIVVVRPNVYAIDGTKRIIEDIYNRTRSSRDLQTYLLFNQVPQVPEMKVELGLWQKLFQDMGYEILPDIPLTQETAYFSAKGLAIYPEESIFHQKILRIVDKLQL